MSAPVTFTKKVAASDMKLAATWRRRRDSNPRNRFSGLHDFQSCALDQTRRLLHIVIPLYCADYISAIEHEQYYIGYRQKLQAFFSISYAQFTDRSKPLCTGVLQNNCKALHVGA